MEPASPEHSSEQPPGHIANLVGLVITAMTLTLPLYAISNFSTAEVIVPQQPASLPASLSVRLDKPALPQGQSLSYQEPQK